LATQAVHMMGATCLTLVEPIAARRELGLRYGAEHVIDPTAVDVKKAAMELTNGRGYDVVIDCSGSTKAVYDLPYITAFGGKLVYAAMYPNTYEMPLNLYKFLYANELTLTGMYVSPYTFPRAWQVFPKFRLEEFTSTVFPIDEAEEAFKAQVSGKHIKILIECNKFE
jgi:threonine dehydrogenase-like Zn-dependent dehydrogenase